MTEDYIGRTHIDHHLHAGTITTKEHEAIHLHDIKRLSYRQIALGLKVSHTTIADRVARARQKIRLAERNPAA